MNRAVSVSMCMNRHYNDQERDTTVEWSAEKHANIAERFTTTT